MVGAAAEAAAKSGAHMTKHHVKAGEYVGQSMGGKRHGKGSYTVLSCVPYVSAALSMLDLRSASQRRRWSEGGGCQTGG